MTRHKHTHTGLVTPQLPQLWLTAVLRVFAVLVQSVSSTLRMIRRRSPVIGTRETPPVLPRETSDTDQEIHAAQHRSRLNTVSPSPSPSVSLTTSAIHLPLLRRWRTEWGASSTAVGGGGGLRALARKTEGASHALSGSAPLVRVPREGGGPVLLSGQPSRIPSRHSGSPPSRGTRRRETTTA